MYKKIILGIVGLVLLIALISVITSLTKAKATIQELEAMPITLQQCSEYSDYFATIGRLERLGSTSDDLAYLIETYHVGGLTTAELADYFMIQAESETYQAQQISASYGHTLDTD